MGFIALVYGLVAYALFFASFLYLIVFVGESLGDWISNRPPGFFAVIIIGFVIVNRTRIWIAKKRELARQASGASPPAASPPQSDPPQT